MGKISDEIRRWCEDLDSGDVPCTTFDLYALAGRIDAEMVELPRDRDGVPIHVGDTVYLDDGRKAEVTRIDLMPTKTCIVCWTSDKKDVAYLPSGISHKQTDSLESIASGLEDMVDDMLGQDTVTISTLSELRDFADRIRKLAEKED